MFESPRPFQSATDVANKVAIRSISAIDTLLIGTASTSDALEMKCKCFINCARSSDDRAIKNRSLGESASPRDWQNISA